MALNQTRGWLVCYDIRDARRLARFHRFIKRHAVPVQHSVFCYQGSAAQLGRLVREMESRIDRKADDVRVYQLPERPHFEALGKDRLPAGVMLQSAENPSLPCVVGSGKC